MGVPGNADLLLLRSAAAAGGYQVERSLRFNSSDSAYCSRVPSTAGNRKTWTWSGWVKRQRSSSSDTLHLIMTAGGIGGSNTPHISFDSSDKFGFDIGGGTAVRTLAALRDFSAWYHLVVAFDTTQATAANRCKLYVNGVQQSDNGTTFSLNQESTFNFTNTHAIGTNADNIGNFSFPGYLADIHFIDGQALTPSSFTETDATTGQLIPKAYTGSFGTNGFWLKFSDNSAATATTLGKDYSGNSNNWTPNNLSVTAGAGNDSLVDTPTSYGTDTGAGGEVRGNYATLNPLDTGTVTLANGNLDVTFGTSARGTRATFGVSTGKYYFEMTVGGFGTNGPAVGVAYANANITTSYAGSDANAWVYNGGDGKIYNNGTGTGSNATYTTNDVIGVAINMDSGTVTFYKNNSAQSSTVTGLSGAVFPVVTSGGTAGVQYFNFGQRPFAYTAPSGFKALCDTNLPAPVVAKSSDYFQTVLWTGNGGSQSISSLSFSPDFVWIKARSAGSTDHCLFDTIRGATKGLHSNQTIAEWTDTATLTAFNSDGFTLAGHPYTNGNGTTYVGWTWDAGSSTVTNTQGSITTSLRASASSGFSVISYTGTGSAGASIGHGLGVAPAFALFKNRSTSSDWQVYHVSLGNAQSILLQSTAAAGSSSAFNSTSPTSTVITLGAGTSLNNNGSSHICYAWAPVAGYSSAFSYSGNGSSDGPMVWLGFRPRFIIQKRTDSAGSWLLIDTARDPVNVARNEMFANSSAAEYDNGSLLDVLSNGFKIRATFANMNASGGSYIGFAFAENPFQYARAR